MKSDELVAKYKLHLKQFDQLDGETQAKVEKDVADFISQMLNQTGLDFAFSVPDDKITMGGENLTLAVYLGQVKNILNKYGLIKENQNIEDSIREIITSLNGMSRSDIDWEKISLWKKDLGSIENDLRLLAVNQELKAVHVRTLRSF